MAGKMVRCAEGHFCDTGKHGARPWWDSNGAAKDAGPLPSRPTGATKRLDMTQEGAMSLDFRSVQSKYNILLLLCSVTIGVYHGCSVTGTKRAILAFDPEKRAYGLFPGEAQRLVYLRDELVNTPVQAGPYEVMEIGASGLVPVPFDTGKYSL